MEVSRPSQKADLIIINGSPLITMAGTPGPRRGKELSSLGSIASGAVAIGDGKILGTGSSAEILESFGRMPNGAAAPRIIDAKNRIDRKSVV